MPLSSNLRSISASDKMVIMASANEIRKQLSLYTSEQLDMEAFRNWFAPVLRDVHKLRDDDTEKFAHSVEWEFADFSRGLSTETALKEKLARLASVALRDRAELLNSAVPVDRLYFLAALPAATMFDQSSAGSGSGNANGTTFSSFAVESNEPSLVLSELVLTGVD